jgi:putative tricarboxylic transport membrane protein
MDQQEDLPAASSKSVEIAVAAIILIFGIVVIVDSVRLGISWGDEGPKAGYFPFYVGLLLCFSSAITLFRAIRAGAGESFVSRGQLKLVTTVYVGFIAVLGIYVASIIYIAFFMWWLGKYPWLKIVPVAFGVNAAFFLMFEVWFKVPLPKGPLETVLGLS